jgi:hypothetical protein
MRKKSINILKIFYYSFSNFLLLNPINFLKSLYPIGQAS